MRSEDNEVSCNSTVTIDSKLQSSSTRTSWVKEWKKMRKRKGPGVCVCRLKCQRGQSRKRKREREPSRKNKKEANMYGPTCEFFQWNWLGRLYAITQWISDGMKEPGKKTQAQWNLSTSIYFLFIYFLLYSSFFVNYYFPDATNWSQVQM